MHLLDTDTLSRLHAAHPRVTARLQALQDPVVGITIVTMVETKVELLRGRIDFLLKAATGPDVLRAQYWLARTEALLAPMMIMQFDDVAAARFDALRATPSIRAIGRADLLNASIALAHRATLVTRNVRHFRRIGDLTVVNWVD